MKRIFGVVFLLAACISSKAPAEPRIELKDAAVIDQPIFSNNLEVVGHFITESVNKRDAVHLIINSPGGSIMSGFAFLSRMDDARARGLKIKCYVPDLAASMAFQILLHCDTRYALPRAALLWHRVSVQIRGASLNALNTADLLRELKSADKLIVADLKEHLPVSDDVIMFHLDKETLHTAKDLNELAPGFFEALPTSIEGLYEAMDSEDVVRQHSPMDDILRKLFGGEIFYIRKEFMFETLQTKQ